ncbi:uncharacterized protein LOC134209710 [Armigeres subalbatus]|uniref:uncharacterized protein LOC134209710 n=1 Tax=Armigeres subalbatus TaxID=124917 RepID=UPI002ED5076E
MLNMERKRVEKRDQTWRIHRSFVTSVCVWLMIGFHYTSAQDCTSLTFDFSRNSILLGEISATAINEPIADHEVSYVESVIASTWDGYNLYLTAYLNTTQDPTRLIVATDENFANFPIEETLPELRAQLEFSCASGTKKTIRIQVTIRNENLYAPTFELNEYIIQLPLPLPKNFDLTQYVNNGSGIIAHDYDLTDNEVDFAIADNEYFQVEQVIGASAKEFIARIRTTQTIIRLDTLDLELTGTDQGDPPRSGVTHLKISGDPLVTYIEPPHFVESLYRSLYKRTEPFVPVEIGLTSGTYDGTVSFELSGLNADHFTLTEKSDKSGATIGLRSDVDIAETISILTVQITASRNGTDSDGRTAVVVEVEQEVKILPAFEQVVYSGTIDQEKVITLGDPVKLVAESIVGGVNVTLGGENAEYFDYVNADGTITLRTTDKLTEEVLSTKFYFHITVEASRLDVGSSVAFVILEVLAEDEVVPRFEQLYYEGTITEEGVSTIPEIIIVANTFVDGLTITRASDEELFILNQVENKATLVANNITEAHLNGKIYLLERITAVVESQVVAETIIIISIIRPNIIVPVFENNYIEGQLTEANLQLTPITVVIDASTHNGDTNVTLHDSNDLFELVRSTIENEYILNLRTEPQLPTTSHITAIIEAVNPKSATAVCFVSIEIIREPLIAPAFEEVLYESIINQNGILQELTLRLKPGTYDDSIDINLIGADAELFQWHKLENNDIQITLNESTTGEDLENRNNLRFSVQAVTSASLEATVPVIVFIEVAEVQIPRFEKALYKSTISSDLTLVPFEAILLEDGTGAEGLGLQILQNNSDLFTVELEEGKRIEISLTNELTPEDLEEFDRFEFVIQVTNPGVGSASTTIVIDVERSIIIVPEFTQVAYHGTLQEGSRDMVFTENITLQSETIASGVKYEVLSGDYSLVKFAENEDASLKFLLEDDVTVEQLKSYDQINFVVQAVNPGSIAALASIVVQIIRPTRPIFTKSSFSGVLTEGLSGVDLASDPIQFEEGTLLEGIVFRLTEGASAFFHASISPENIIQLSLDSEVSWSQIRSSSYLSFKMTATNPGSDSSTSTIIINVVNTPVPTPTFTKSFYRGSLQKGVRDVSFSASEVITVDSETITSTFTFHAIDDDAALFDVTRDENKFKVALNSTVEDQTIDGRDVLSFAVEANNEYGETARATVIVSIQLDEIVTPVFSKSIYQGSIKERTTDVLFSTEISLQEQTSSSNTDVGLIDGEADWFTAVYEDSKVNIVVNEENAINWDEIGDRTFLSFVLQATNPGSIIASAFVTLDIERELIVIPRFKSSSFQGVRLEGSRDVQFAEGGSIEFVAGSLVAGFHLELTGYDSNLFDFVQNGHQVSISLKEDAQEENFKDRTYLRFDVAVNNPGSETAVANVLVDLQWNSTSVIAPLFEKLLYQGSIGLDLQLKLDDGIVIKEETYTDDVQYEITESNSDLLEVEKENRVVVVKLAKTISEEDLKDFSSLHVTIRAFNAQGQDSICFLSVAVLTDGEEPCTTDCTECYDCSTGAPLEDVPVFEYGNYRFFIKSDITGLIGTVKATVNDPSVALEHRAVISNSYIRSRITLTVDGILRVDQTLIPGQYSFQVTALHPTSQKQTSVSVLLDVTQEQECPADPDAPKVTTVEKLLHIVSLQEESPHLNIFPSQLGSCEYKLVDENPYLDYSYFEIDSQTHWLTSRSFDRENTSLFEGMTVPQFQVRLQLICPEQTSVETRRTKRSLIETDDLNYARDVTVVQVVVTDVNDHEPQFIEPAASASPFHIGFPISTIASGLMLPHLITVQAEDADEGLNAKVRYSLSSQNYFAVEEETGIIYPLKEAIRSNSAVMITVRATDRDGASDGLSSIVQLSVHRLEEDNLVAMTVPGQIDGDDLIQQLSANEENIQLRVLSQARVSEVSETTDRKFVRQSSFEDSIIRMIVYAFNAQHEVQSSDTIIRVIKATAVPTSISVDSYSNVACANAECSERQSSSEDNVGLIAATSVLGALFIISAGVAIFLYLGFVRPFKSSTANSSDIVQLENDFEVSPPPSPPMLGVGKQLATNDSDQEDRKDSIQILGITDQESEDSTVPSSRLARSLDERLEKADGFGTVSSRGTIEDSSSLSAQNEPRNVRFNELVERIEVVEHHPEDKAHKIDLEDDDSVYSERL